MSFRKAQHDGLISLATYERIQERLTGNAKAPARKDISEDFPLRGFVLCHDCGKPLTACWSKSRSGKLHHYYLCPNKACVSYRNSIRRDQLEGEFEAIIQGLQPSRTLFTMAKGMFTRLWDFRLSHAEQVKRRLQKGAGKIEKQIDALLERIIETGSASLIAAYEKKIASLEREKARLEEQILSTGNPRGTLEKSFEPVLEFPANPWNLWKNGTLAVRKTVLRLAFLSPVSYCRNQGVRTPEIAFPFRYLSDIQAGKCEMAHP